MTQNDSKMRRFHESLWVATGGSLGSLARHAMDVLQFPVSIENFRIQYVTFVINLIGAFILGLVLAWAAQKEATRKWARLFVGIGFCGSFTTFSSITLGVVFLQKSGALAEAVLYVSATIVAGLAAAFAGGKMITWIAHD